MANTASIGKKQKYRHGPTHPSIKSTSAEAHTVLLEQHCFPRISLVVDTGGGLPGGDDVGETPPVVVGVLRQASKFPVLAVAGPLAAGPRSW